MNMTDDRTTKFGGCPGCGRQACVAMTCKAPTEEERAEFLRKFLGDPAALSPESSKEPTTASAMTDFDGGENPPNKTLYAVMAKYSLNLVVGADMKHLLDFGRDCFRLGQIGVPALRHCDPEPVMYVSEGQLSIIQDAEVSPFSTTLIWARKTPSGKFQLPLYRKPA